jgi:hypothetical protein
VKEDDELYVSENEDPKTSAFVEARGSSDLMLKKLRKILKNTLKYSEHRQDLSI